MNKICTSIDQSKKLVELGIDVNTSDMYWSLVNKNHPPIIGKYCAEYGGMQLPAWSLSALLELMPILTDNIYYKDYPELGRCIDGNWVVESAEYNTKSYDNPLDAAFEMVCWLKENKKI